MTSFDGNVDEQTRNSKFKAACNALDAQHTEAVTKMAAGIAVERLMYELELGEKSGAENGWLTIDELESKLDTKD